MRRFKKGDEVTLKGKIIRISDHSIYPVVCLFGDTEMSFTTDGAFEDRENKMSILQHDTNISRLVQVRDSDKKDWVQRVFIKEVNSKIGKYICWASSETMEEALEDVDVEPWNQMREIPLKKKISIDEIAKKFKCSVEEIEIIYNQENG